ncbi:hypothetical protein GCM10007276_33230 [Agaricicola taiwanensis]|uniref:Uncharacterized protein n=1 Tax=Agaricicola taiwanensis TaxID=591372 RepID=A0A8J2YN00_9RHOB|nr:hypothetical protein [Agaricicola taiwanensis]GGE53563.1 hypothetical protein GCM10007276_33230 [Agaricicola taiwanensis]
MTDARIIEISGTAVGLVTREKSHYLFHAADPRVLPLEGRVFSSPQDATRSARQLVDMLKRDGARRVA